MAGITLAQAESNLALWITASEKVAAGQSYRIGSREFTRVNAEHITKMIDYWQKQVERLSSSTGGGIRVRGITPG